MIWWKKYMCGPLWRSIMSKIKDNSFHISSIEGVREQNLTLRVYVWVHGRDAECLPLHECCRPNCRRKNLLIHRSCIALVGYPPPLYFHVLFPGHALYRSLLTKQMLSNTIWPQIYVIFNDLVFIVSLQSRGITDMNAFSTDVVCVMTQEVQSCVDKPRSSFTCNVAFGLEWRWKCTCGLLRDELFYIFAFSLSFTPLIFLSCWRFTL